MKAVNLREALAGARVIDLDADPSLEEVREAFPRLGSFDAGDITLGRWSGSSPWERHVDGDELLLVLEGELELTVLSETESARVKVGAGSLLVVPRGRWHRGAGRDAAVLTLRATEHGPVSFAEDPRSG